MPLETTHGIILPSHGYRAVNGAGRFVSALRFLGDIALACFARHTPTKVGDLGLTRCGYDRRSSCLIVKSGIGLRAVQTGLLNNSARAYGPAVLLPSMMLFTTKESQRLDPASIGSRLLIVDPC